MTTEDRFDHLHPLDRDLLASEQDEAQREERNRRKNLEPPNARHAAEHRCDGCGRALGLDEQTWGLHDKRFCRYCGVCELAAYMEKQDKEVG